MADQLDDIRIATPCTMNWSEMSGDDQKRFCGSCRLNVYNVRMMTRGEAVRLIQETEGRVCLRLYRRHDGTVITKDCPVGLAALRARIVRGVGVSVAAFLGLMGFGSFVNERQQKGGGTDDVRRYGRANGRQASSISSRGRPYAGRASHGAPRAHCPERAGRVAAGL